ncbi:MAG TPA: 50S ribosomal protein L24e [archaeon]|nr:50S ribosomal protein L24e [archaeon]
MKCSFCGGNLGLGRGKMYVKNTGEIFYYCSSKCQNNFKMGRSSKKLKWSRKK